MKIKNAIVIFGDDDYASFEARKVARQAGLMTGTATLGGKPVSSGTAAYKADGFAVDGGGSTEGLTSAIIFECNPAVAGNLEVAARCDHHKPGDPGYGFGPDCYFEASSLGQFMELLGLVPNDFQRLIAASDYCPAQAYDGFCQDITPGQFADHRIIEKVAFYATQPDLAYKATPEALEKVIVSAVTKLKSAPIVGRMVRDLRTAGFIDELQEAALRSHEAYVVELDDTDREGKPTGNRKIVLGGRTDQVVFHLFRAWASYLPNKVGEPYGNYTRGFAEVVVKP